MNRLNLDDTPGTVMLTMSNGNPSAAMALLDTFTHNEEIDPQSALGPYTASIYLDSVRIYGEGIYLLYSNQCNRNVRKFLMLLRAAQLGHYPVERLQSQAADGSRYDIISESEWKELEYWVCDSLEGFAKPCVPEDA